MKRPILRRLWTQSSINFSRSFNKLWLLIRRKINVRSRWNCLANHCILLWKFHSTGVIHKAFLHGSSTLRGTREPTIPSGFFGSESPLRKILFVILTAHSPSWLTTLRAKSITKICNDNFQANYNNHQNEKLKLLQTIGTDSIVYS